MFDIPIGISLKVTIYFLGVFDLNIKMITYMVCIMCLSSYLFEVRNVKYNITWNDNGTVTYGQNRTFLFIPEKSSGLESDMFLTANPVYCVSM